MICTSIACTYFKHSFLMSIPPALLYFLGRAAVLKEQVWRPLQGNIHNDTRHSDFRETKTNSYSLPTSGLLPVVSCVYKSLCCIADLKTTCMPESLLQVALFSLLPDICLCGLDRRSFGNFFVFSFFSVLIVLQCSLRIYFAWGSEYFMWQRY